MSKKIIKKNTKKKNKSDAKFSQSSRMRRPVAQNVTKKMQLALQYYHAGRLSKAAEIYQQVLDTDPSNVEACHILGVVYTHLDGKVETAIQLLRKAIRIRPNIAEAHSNLGNALQKSGKTEEAIASYRKALAINPKLAAIHNNLGNALLEIGRIDEAISCFQNALVLKPDFVDVYCRLGSVLFKEGRVAEAVNNYRKALAINPNYAEIYNNLGNIYQQAGRLDDAIDNFQKAISVKPDFAEAYNNLGSALRESGRSEEAISCLRMALSTKPDFAEAHSNLGNALQDAGRLEEAIGSFKKAIALKPNFAETYFNLGNLLQQSGKAEDAIINFKKALSLRPTYGEPYRTLAAIKKHTEYDDEVRAMEGLYNRKDLANEDKIHLGFALGKIFEDFNQYDKSFHFISEANRLKRGSYKYSIEVDQDLFERIKIIFSAEFFVSHKDSGYLDDTPIFIVGMPRSGTTLVEQILASHPLVIGAGELMDFINLSDSFCAAAGGQFPECFQQVDAAKFKSIGSAYIKSIRKHSKDAKHITDKLPHNFLRVGLIKVILPQAKIIHCRRDPMDNCLSIYKNYFGVKGSHEYAYDQNELGQYYRLYLDLMEHWDNVLPGFMYSLKYEEMVADQKNQTEKLLDFCGLPWDEACLSFHKTKRRVQTASLAQVRKPIYHDSVELWKRYETQLAPLYKAISCNNF